MDKNKNKELEELGAWVLEKAKEKGADTADVSLTQEVGFSVSSRLGQVETVEHHRDQAIALTIYFGQQTGSASSSDLSPEAIERVLDKACNIAKYTSPDPFSGLADKALLAYDYPTLALDFPWDVSTEQALQLAIECEDIARGDPRISNSEGATIHSHRTLQLYANTHGFVGSYFSTQHSLSCVLIAQENGNMHRDYEYTVARDPADLMSPELLAKKVADKTANRVGARRLKTRSAPVIFSAEIARAFLGHFISAISGGNLYRKSSFLVDHLNKQIFPKNLNLIQVPHMPKALGSAPFDSEGVRTIEQAYVREGILQSYILGSYSARKLGLVSTGNSGGVFNLQITTNDLSFDDLLQEMGTGLLVTELIGQGINIVTGDYSRGAFGYWVENGEIKFPVEEVTIAGNLRDMFLNIVAISNDLDTRGRVSTGSILIKEMMIAGE